jgi:CIC family chloride channel protein
VGLGFGLVATSVFPEVSGSETLYALAGMGALAAAVLGAPISTTLIVFELTGDWQTGIAVMVSVSLSSAVASRLVDRSYFLTQLERKGIHLAAGPQAYLLAAVRVATLLRPPAEDGPTSEAECWTLINAGVYVDAAATLETAMPIFDKGGAVFLPVVTLFEDRPPELLGILHQVDALKAYNRALAATAEEEHS